MTMALHRAGALVLGLFILTHFAAHLAAIGGPEAHAAALAPLQAVYRNRNAEPILIFAIASQLITGGRRLLRRMRAGGVGFWGWTQILSGAYLGFFLLLHMGAALMARHVYDLDTNFYWPAGTLTTRGIFTVFAVYYVLGVTAVFAHLAAAAHFALGERPLGRWLSPWLIVFGAGLGLTFVLIFSGAFFEISLPDSYQDYFSGYSRFFNASG